MARDHLHHDELFEVLREHPLGTASWVRQLLEIHEAADRAASRYVRFLDRERRSLPANAWALIGGGTFRAGHHYKGLFHCKTPFDMALYTMLLWEQKPATIVELGSFHGGSALWFADQLGTITGGGAVHSFERYAELVSRRAVHPRLTFHQADLADPGALDPALLGTLAHPWLVVDDAHANVCEVLRALDRCIRPGDYYVVEDITADFESARYEALGLTLDELGYLVDTAYTDNFGLNLTCAPNGWLRKME
jgi:cephalosporin hydroxylase